MLKQGTKVLITGGAGFIGSHLARALAASGCEVRVLDDLSTGKRERISAVDGIELLHGDVRNPAAVTRAMQGCQAVVHLAGVQPGVDAIRAQEVNLGGALHILSAARQVADRRERPRVILCGSASVYGRQTGFVLHEELTPRPMTPEAVMALAMEHYGRVYREAYNVPVVNLRIFRVFGPDEDETRDDAGIVTRFIKAALDGKSPVIYGDGQQTRDLVYIDNVVAAIVAALTVEDPPAEPLNIASGEAVAINFLWNLVLETCGKKRLAIDPTYVPAPPWEMKHSRPQIARACKVLGWAPAMRLREGLARTVEHYRALRNQDPNAWFAPREEAQPRKKLGFPAVAVPTRRFGSVVTPLFGAGADGSSASPLPVAGSGATPLPAGDSAATPLPARNSSASPLPTRSSAATPLPARNSSASPLPTRSSAATPLPARSSSAAPLPTRSSTTTPLPTRSSTATQLPTRNSTATQLPTRNSTATQLPTRNSTATQLPTRSSTAAPLPSKNGAPANGAARPAAPPLPPPPRVTGKELASDAFAAALASRPAASPPGAPSPSSASAPKSAKAGTPPRIPPTPPRPSARRDATLAYGEVPFARTSPAARPSAPPPGAAHHRDEILEVSDADLLEDRGSNDDDEELDFEWAPVPALPGLGS